MSEYWQKRFQMIEDARNKVATETVHSITPAFDQAQAQIEKEINAWYARFAKNNEISLVEAKKLLNSRELKEFRWDVKEYIKYGRENAIDQKWMKELENASSRFHISRLEALKIRTQNAAERAFGNELDAIDEMAARVYMDDYYHTAYEIQKGLGVGWNVGQIDQSKLDKIVSKPWTTDKQTFSDRIWKSKTQLLDSVHTELTQMCILGKAPDEAIKNIAKRMDVSKGQAGRLVMTEAAYFGSVAQKDCFNDLDVEKYEIVATLDSKTSEICQQMDGKVFDMKDFQAGVTAPPFHCWCRSCTVPWFEDNDDGTRVARDADGKTYHVPASMKYEDWKQKFVDNSIELNETIKISKKENHNAYSVDRKLVNSKKYHDKFEGLTVNKETNESIYQESMRILEHRDGTGYEDIVAIDAKTGEVVVKNTLSNQIGKSGFTEEQHERLLRHPGKVILLHNHPNSSRLSYADISTLFKNDCIAGGVAVGHDGSVHFIMNLKRKKDLSIDKLWNVVYNRLLEEVQDEDIARHRALDFLYESNLFVYESR